jgi:hypothetical protein
MPMTEAIFGPEGFWTRSIRQECDRGQYMPALMDIPECVRELESALAPATPDIISKAVTLLVGGYPAGKPADAATYCKALELMIANANVPPDLLPALVERVWTESKFLPSPSELAVFAKDIAATRRVHLSVVRSWAEDYERKAENMARQAFRARKKRILDSRCGPLMEGSHWDVQKDVERELVPLVHALVAAIWQSWLEGDADTPTRLCEQMQTDETGADAEARKLAKAYFDRPRSARFTP